MFDGDRTFLFHFIVIVLMWIVTIGVNILKDKIPIIGGSGIPQSRGAVFGRYKFLNPIKLIISKFIGSLAAIGIGLSLGREGPSVQLGTLSGVLVGNTFSTSDTEKRYLKIAGAGAGLAAAFTAPIASVIFLIEDMLEWCSKKIIISSVIACICAGYLAKLIFWESSYSLVSAVAPHYDISILLIILAGFAVMGALCGKLFNVSLFYLKKNYSLIHIPQYIKLLCIVIMVYISGIFILDITAGGEQELIAQTQGGSLNLWWIYALVLIKIFLTCICYSTGLCGSLLLPLIVIGGLLGKAYALTLVNFGIIETESIGYFMMTGMSLVFISVVGAPVSGLMLVLEMTGRYDIFIPTIVVGILTYVFGQYIGMKPIYRKLYKEMFEADKTTPDVYQTEFYVDDDSILLNKNINELKDIPEGIKITGAERYIHTIPKEERQKLSNDEPLISGDLIEVEIKSDNYESLFKITRDITNE